MSEWDNKKYLVIPTKYAQKLSEEEMTRLIQILDKINDIRKDSGKKGSPEYCAFKQSEPYFEKVKKIILEGESSHASSKKRKPLGFFDCRICGKEAGSGHREVMIGELRYYFVCPKCFKDNQ